MSDNGRQFWRFANEHPFILLFVCLGTLDAIVTAIELLGKILEAYR